MKLKKILVAVKPWERGLPPAATRAQKLSERVDAEIELVGTVFDSAVAARQERGESGAHATQGRAVAAALVELERVASSMRDSHVRLTTKVVWGVPAYEGIIRSAEEWCADLIVVTAYEPETLHRRMTDTDWQLLRKVPCPVLFVKTPAVAGYETILAVVDSSNSHDESRYADRAVLAAGRCFADAYGSTLFEGATAETVIDFARIRHTELLIVGAPRPGAALAATSETLAADAPCDVLIVPAAVSVDERRSQVG
jgi:nucleotide-binding universal stress UspA family protein